MLKAFQKVILIFKLELKYILKLIAYTNNDCCLIRIISKASL